MDKKNRFMQNTGNKMKSNDYFLIFRKTSKRVI